MRTIGILLVEPIETITEDTKKLGLLETYHKEPLIGGHCYRKKLYAKLRTMYYWKNGHGKIWPHLSVQSKNR